MTGRRFIYSFQDAPPDDAGLLGGKGMGLARMAQAGLPVPPGFVISTDAFRAFQAEGRRLPEDLVDEIWEAVADLERATGKRFGRPGGVPLLVSVRSGAKVSMPGMMDTILNLGLDPASMTELSRLTGDTRFVVETYLRFWRMYVDIVLGLEPDLIDEATEALGDPLGTDFYELEELVLSTISEVGLVAPRGPREQLLEAVAAVFNSWFSSRAITYRRHHGIPEDLGTAVVVQSMVFGNFGTPSGSGVMFTRDPLTGENRLYGEFLEGGQGEEVVAGTRTPAKIDELRQRLPELVVELESLGRRLEEVYRDALDIEFTVERGTVYLLQVRAAKRTAPAAVRIARELAASGIIHPHEAFSRISADQVRRLMRPGFSPEARAQAEARGDLIARGVGACPGHASGVVMLSADAAAAAAAAGKDVILVRPTTSPQDLHGMLAARGILTALGGATSHAAVVARSLDKPCVVGCGDLEVRPEEGFFSCAGRRFAEGEPISIDGESGSVYAGALPMGSTEVAGVDLEELLRMADRCSGAAVYAIAFTAADVSRVRSWGVTGIGPLGLTELLLAAGAGSLLREVVDAVAAGGRLHGIGERLQQETASAIEQILRSAGSLPVLVTLLDFHSPHSLVSLGLDPAGLPAGLSLPLFLEDLVRAQLRGLAAALDGESQIVVLAPGVSDPCEERAWRQIATEVGSLRHGVVLQSPRATRLAEQVAVAGGQLVVDLSELVRNFFGLSATVLRSEELRQYVEAGRLEGHPALDLDPAIAALLRSAVEAGPSSVVALGPALGDGLVTGLYALGFRSFACALDQVQPLRLLLGQASSRETARV